MIHRTAIVHPDAQLDVDVQIGAYATVGPGVSIGRGTIVGNHSLIERNTRIGEKNRIGAFVTLGTDPQDLSFKGQPTYLEIGDNNTIREYTNINRGAHGEGVTRIGSNNLIMACIHVAHDCQLGNNIIMANLATLAGHITVGDRAVIGGLAAFHQFVRIGTMAMVGGTAGVMQDVPPYCMVQGAPPASVRGLNLVGLKRSGVTQEDINQLKSAYRLYFRRGMSRENALAEIRESVKATPEVRTFAEFLGADSKRGICKPFTQGEASLSLVKPGEGEITPAMAAEIRRQVEKALREREEGPPATDDVSGLSEGA